MRFMKMDQQSEELKNALKADTGVRDRLGLSQETHERQVDVFFDFQKRDEALTHAFNASSVIPYTFLLAYAGIPLGALGGGGLAGFYGYKLGEFLNDTYEIVNNLAKVAVDIGCTSSLGLLGIVAGGVAGFFVGGGAGALLGNVMDYLGDRDPIRKEQRENSRQWLRKNMG